MSEVEQDIDVVIENHLRFINIIEAINTRLKELRELVKDTHINNLDEVDRERWACIRELENLKSINNIWQTKEKERSP